MVIPVNGVHEAAFYIIGSSLLAFPAKNVLIRCLASCSIHRVGIRLYQPTTTVRRDRYRQEEKEKLGGLKGRTRLLLIECCRAAALQRVRTCCPGDGEKDPKGRRRFLMLRSRPLRRRPRGAAEIRSRRRRLRPRRQRRPWTGPPSTRADEVGSCRCCCCWTAMYKTFVM